MRKILGVNLSPFVRKVRVALAEKGVEYELEPIMPGMVPPEFKEKSPLGKIPVLQEDGLTIPDSSVIIAYLERTHPTPPLYPADPAQMARALFLEEYADTKLTEATLPAFVNNVVRKKFMNQEPDAEAIAAAREVAKEVFAYLEDQLEAGKSTIVGDQLTVADLAIGSPFVNMQYGGETVDAARYPKLASYVANLHARPSFKALIEEEQAGLPK